MRRPGTRLLTLLALWLMPLFLVRTVWRLAIDDQTRIVDANLTLGSDNLVLLVVTVVWCGQARRVPIQFGRLGTSNLPRPLPSEIWIMAVNPDGRVLLTRPKYSPNEIYVVRP
ncbi:hypothetical protein ACFQO7_11255 [Catellatospora aurea]|uniref:PH (Pleckstrin Homology) domain-containing protein n=1 Tax=Catellatospora aurea TaxID=1337874 RepID=A0ABW2GW51_9ACTN